MATRQPIWKCVANLGDINPLDYGGCFVYVDRTGIYPPEIEVLEPLDDDRGNANGWLVYRAVLEPCTYIDGILSDNKFHPEIPAWFAKPESERVDRPQDTTYLANVARTVDQSVEELIAGFLDLDPIARAHSWLAIASYHGWNELDQYPRTYTKRSELPRRFVRGKVQNGGK